jgi:hypothetical protein
VMFTSSRRRYLLLRTDSWQSNSSACMHSFEMFLDVIFAGKGRHTLRDCHRFIKIEHSHGPYHWFY